MAPITFALATSHGPMLNVDPGRWALFSEFDRARPDLYFRGRQVTYQELLATRQSEDLAAELDLASKQRPRFEACHKALRRLAEAIEDNAPDVAIIFNADHKETFDETLFPAVAIYTGSEIRHAPIADEQLRTLPSGIAEAMRGYNPVEPRTYAAAPTLAQHLVENLCTTGFDPAVCARIPDGVYANGSIPHGFGFIYEHIMAGRVIPNVPVFLNTFYPPNRLSVRRAYEFGRAVGRAVASWSEERRVAICASGGLSHFVVEKDLDVQLLEALRRGDGQVLTAIPDDRLQAGSSEMLNWIALGGALADTDLKMELVDYIPCYRTVAGTGNAMGFVKWS